MASMVSGRIIPEITGFHPEHGAPYNRPLQTGQQQVESVAEPPLQSNSRTGHPDAMHDIIPDFTDTELWVIRLAARGAANPATN